MKYTFQYGQELEELLSKAARDKKLLHEFLFDLLSPAEYKDLAVRWQIVRFLWEGVPQREIAQRLHVSVATVTRGSREMMNKKGGFRKILEKHFKRPSQKF